MQKLKRSKIHILKEQRGNDNILHSLIVCLDLGKIRHKVQRSGKIRHKNV